MAEPGNVTELLRRWGGGEREALEALIPLVYQELRRLANHLLQQERDGHTLQSTALVHEAYLRLVQQRSANLEDRAHFFAIAAQAMRRILVDHARRRQAAKREGSARVSLEAALTVPVEPDVDLVALDASLDELAAFDAQKSRVVELRYFGGLSIQEIATALEISPATVKRHWTLARAWLYQRMEGSAAAP